MSHHPTSFQGSITDAAKAAIEAAIPGAVAEVTGGGGHFQLVVTASAFAGKGMVDCHRMVLSSIAHLMQGDMAPIHAVDSLRTKSA